jgi:chromosome segregation ATPase
MAKKKKAVKKKKRPDISSAVNALSFHTDLVHVKRQIQKMWDRAEKAEERIQDIEIHLNLLTRLLTALCVEKFGMRIGVLKRMIKRIEKEAIRDSQIVHLEALYKLPANPEKKVPPPEAPGKNDPWEDIS